MTGLVFPVDTRRKNVDVSQDTLGTDHLDAVVMPIGIIAVSYTHLRAHET